jgi:HPt (histidine-containing phosphotransfer) domain-containing protein
MLNTANTSEHVSNLDYLTSLSKGNAGFVQEMLDIFLAENPAEVNALQEAVTAADFEQIQHLAHHMRSTIPFVGLGNLLGTPLAETEDFAKNKTDLPQIKIHMKEISRVCLKATQELSTDSFVGKPIPAVG